MPTSPRRTSARNSTAVTFWKEMCACDVRGDQHGYMRARTALFEMFERLSFRYVAALLGQEWLSPQDIMQECRLAVLQAIDDWEPERGEFPVLLHYHVRNRVRKHLRMNEPIQRSSTTFERHGQERCHYQDQSDTGRIPVVSLDDLQREEWLTVPAADPYLHLQLETAVAQALDYLDDKSRREVSLHFGLDGCKRHTYQEMAAMLGHTKQAVHQRIQKALPILAAVLEEP